MSVHAHLALALTIALFSAGLIATSYDLISRVATLNLKAMLTKKSGADLRKDVGQLIHTSTCWQNAISSNMIVPQFNICLFGCQSQKLRSDSVETFYLQPLLV